MPKMYPAQYRRWLCERMLAGEPVARLSEETGVNEATLFRWKKQAKIDAGRAPGLLSCEADELRRANREIEDLKAELQLVKDASELFDSTAVVDPKGGSGSPRDS